MGEEREEGRYTLEKKRKGKKNANEENKIPAWYVTVQITTLELPEESEEERKKARP